MKTAIPPSRPRRPDRREDRRRGSALIEIVLGLAVGGIIFTTTAGMMQQDWQAIRDEATAAQMTVVNDSVANWLRSIDESTGTTVMDRLMNEAPTSFDLDDVPDRFLPAGFASRNPYQQEYHVRVRALPDDDGDGTPDGLQVLVATSGGKAISRTAMPMIAASVGAEGGFIGPPPTGGNVSVVGAFGGWEEPVDVFDPGPSGAPDLESGRLASLLQFGETGTLDEYLYRTEVPGFDDANRMFTSLHMGENDLNEVNCLKFGGAGEECGEGDVMNELRAPQAVVLNDLHQGRILREHSASPDGRLRTDMSVWVQNRLEVDGQITGHDNIHTTFGNIVTDLGNIQTGLGDIASMNGNFGTTRGGVYARSGASSLTQGLGAPYDQPGSIWADNVVAAAGGLQTFRIAGAGSACSSAEAGMLAREGDQGTVLHCSRNTDGSWSWKSAFMGELLVEEEVACYDDYNNDKIYDVHATCPSGTRMVGCTGSEGSSLAAAGPPFFGYGWWGWCGPYWRRYWCGGWYFPYWGPAGTTNGAGYINHDVANNRCTLKLKNPRCNDGWGWYGGWWWGRYYHRYWWGYRYYYWWHYPYRWYWYGNWWNWWHYYRPQDAELQRVQALCERI